MHRGTHRTGKILAALTLGALFQAVAPIGCAGYLQQNLEVLYRFNSIANMPEMWQSLIWKIFGGPS
jgi:hypothetical protein